jgi:1-acyl-sn-glycerol-3-phosphate acyltransferase
MKNLIATFGVAIVLGFIVLIFLWPLVVIWAVNTLFALGIAYTFWTWLAVLVLTMTFGKTNVKINKEKQNETKGTTEGTKPIRPSSFQTSFGSTWKD